jgi:hypothetical protein
MFIIVYFSNSYLRQQKKPELKIWLVYNSGAQPSARGHFFARQPFFKSPQDLFQTFFVQIFL